MRKVIVVLALVSCSSLFAQTVTVGTLPQTGAIQFTVTPATFIDLTHPATASGAINTATVRWYAGGGGTCATAFKVKFIHPNASGTGFSVTERGPFSATLGNVTVQISPPVNVFAGDYIGVTVLGALDTCGTVTFTSSDPSQRMWAQNGDLGATGDFNTGTFETGLTMGALGKSAAEYLAAVVPAAGAYPLLRTPD
ncbi:MAG TPA: hypothetical protein VGJ81_01390 [Thermoanaerobaculia bacterium]|jgi:hypothetical protein